MNLPRLIDDLRAFPGIRRKRDIGRFLAQLEGAWNLHGEAGPASGPGDDAAVVQGTGRPYLLLASDGIMPELVQRDPYRAGRAAVLVNANDIYAMGGRPLAMVNVVSGVTPLQEDALCRGMRDECLRLDVPMVGGHRGPDGGETPFLAVSVLGQANALLADRNTVPDQAIVLAVDMRGERWGDYLFNWDSHVFKDRATLCRDLGILCELAENGLCRSAKDVSNAGILGTLAMLLEHAGLGGTVDLGLLHVPEAFSLSDWLKVFPSYGFFLTCDRDRVKDGLDRFRDRGIWARKVGETDSSKRLRLRWEAEEVVLFDFSREAVVTSRHDS